MSQAIHSKAHTDPASETPGSGSCSASTETRDDARAAAEECRGWLGVAPCVFDRRSGELLFLSEEQPVTDWDRYADVCGQVATAGRPEVIAEETPLAAISFPIADKENRFAAASWFVTGRAEPDAIESAGKSLGLEINGLNDWASRADLASPNVLMRLASLALDRREATNHVDRVDCEVEKLSNHLCQTYEEISLIYRLTHNLTLSRSEEELGELALRWLAEIMSSEGLALQFYEQPVTGEQSGLNMATRLRTYGPCPVDNRQFNELIATLDLIKQRRPLVANGKPPKQDAWAWPKLRDVVLVPMTEGNELFGWLAAFNHADGGEFGTVEADLMNSVTAILGIHRGNTLLYRQQIDLLGNMVRALTSSIDAKDPYTRGHSDRVARGAVVLAEELGCDEETLDTIYLSGLLHDIGKIGIDDTVLRKPDKLTVEEFEHIKTHVTVGYNILRDIKQLQPALPVVLHHHEAWDGSGYPHGLAGENIPYLARITAVADAFDAMGSDRPYRAGMPDEKLDSVLREGAGKQWDTKVVDAFFRQRKTMREIARGEHKGNPRDLTNCWRI
ncbi:MAG: HD-GYP domain-containing protein [Pirellulales bacterium]|nr:HD-GYP domain-containing protein [Pirellulales bacterium]